MTIETEKLAAMRELADYVWDSDNEWDVMKDAIFNADISAPEPEFFILHSAAKIKDRMFEYFSIYYKYLEEADLIESFEVCKDCYDVLTAGDVGAMEDVFIHHYGEEQGVQRFMEVLISIVAIENRGLIFDKEIPELLNTFSKNPCHCCKSNLHGERFFMVYNKLEEKDEKHHK